MRLYFFSDSSPVWSLPATASRIWLDTSISTTSEQHASIWNPKRHARTDRGGEHAPSTAQNIQPNLLTVNLNFRKYHPVITNEKINKFTSRQHFFLISSVQNNLWHLNSRTVDTSLAAKQNLPLGKFTAFFVLFFFVFFCFSGHISRKDSKEIGSIQKSFLVLSCLDFLLSRGQQDNFRVLS